MKEPSKHRQAILIFSFVIPAVLAAIVFGAALYGRGKLSAMYQEKQDRFEEFKRAEVATKELEAELSVEGRKEKIAYWNEKLAQDFVPALSGTIDGILNKYDEEVLRQTSMSQLPGNSSITKARRDSYDLVSLGFEGGFKPMQLLMAELEQEMPQLVLEKINVTPLTNDKNAAEGTGKLTFNLTYLSWKKRDAVKSPES
jgi:hypothetical protein